MKNPSDFAAIRRTFNSYQREVVAPACALTEADLQELVLDDAVMLACKHGLFQRMGDPHGLPWSALVPPPPPR